MRTNFSFPFAFVLILLISFVNYQCKNKDKCDTPIEIEELLPDNNPVGYEIQIIGTGFTQAAIVRFGTKTAVTRWYAEESALIAEVPSGLSGPVEVTVEEGDCIGRADFEVTSGQNTDWPPSLANIVIPHPITNNFPTNFTNAWKNLADNLHGLQLDDDGGTIEIDTTSNEYHFGGNEIFDNNPITGTIDTIPNQIKLNIDRSIHGGINDVLEGYFIFPSAEDNTLAYPFVIWLQSKVSGRQFLLVQS